MKTTMLIPLLLVSAILLAFFLGPRPEDPVYSSDWKDVPKDLSELAAYIEQEEAKQPTRTDNQARIIWADDTPRVTEYSIVYLHGFAGSYRDGYPANTIIADTLQANLYLARWAGHGLRPPASLDPFSAEAAWNSAREALAIGHRIGKKVIVLSTSTGGTLAVKLAATYPDSVYALLNLSPNFKDDQTGSFLLNSPWGYELASLVSFGSHKKIKHEEEIAKQYWDTIYPSRALVDLQVLVGSTMIPPVFKAVNCPVLTLYYHENWLKEDEHVEVSFFPKVHKQFSTPDSLKQLTALSTPKTHFIGSDIKSQDYRVVVEEVLAFLRKVGVAIPDASAPLTELPVADN